MNELSEVSCNIIISMVHDYEERLLISCHRQQRRGTFMLIKFTSGRHFHNVLVTDNTIYIISAYLDHFWWLTVTLINISCA